MSFSGVVIFKKLTLIVILLVELVVDSAQFRESRFTSGRDEVFWSLTDANKTKTCILLSGVFEIEIPYYTDYFMKSIAVIRIPRIASVTGFCDTNENPNLESLSFEWSPDPRQPEVKHSVTLTFKRYSHLKEPSFLEPYYALTTIHGRIQTNEVDFHDPFDPEHIYNLTASDVGAILSAPEKLSFVCKSIQVIKFNDGRNSFAMSEVHAEAFHDKIALGDGKDFGPKSFCAKDGVEVLLMVFTYVIILALFGLAVYYVVDKRRKRAYVYL
ncbi:uncharacterized protein LOC110848209 isoform X2 [Folsomia candida]|uniref:uncharacterized protein LOC110848209 isoform X2 n=1 Tax=Folsomia candida TaxID=158441 RepID=UPI0016054CE5|nr:uncharacterized protein LOC110848209 isoform X2 [Folsomia candida]